MALYLTKVWGFDEPAGPLQFGKAGWRDEARAKLLPGDLVVLVGTKGLETSEVDRGCLLGLMEPTTEPVLSLDFPLVTLPEHFTDGEYKWPYGLLNRRAWRFLDRRLLDEVTSRQFGMAAASGVVLLTDEEAGRILQLRREEIPLLRSVRVEARIEGQEVARRRGAPPPATKRDGVMHLRSARAYTYAMEIRGATKPSFKIGWAFDHQIRSRQFNSYSLPQIGGLCYQVVFSELWETAREAFRMEQDLLHSFDSRRHPANREVVFGVSYDELRSAWGDSILRVRKTPRVSSISA
jgi:hypothetical protein